MEFLKFLSLAVSAIGIIRGVFFAIAKQDSISMAELIIYGTGIAGFVYLQFLA